MSQPNWLVEDALLLLHAESLAEHGGQEGIRDIGLLRSALARQRNLLAYEGVADIPRLAAAYGVGIMRNHPFADGNKRVAFIAVGLFLAINGHRLVADPVDATLTMLSVAARRMTEEELAIWIRANSRPR